MDYDAVIAEGFKPADAQPQPVAKEEVETPITETEAPEGSTEPQASDTPREEAFPRKAVNAISYRDRKIGKLQAELAQLKSVQNTPQKPAPEEADFEGKPYGEYLKEVVKHENLEARRDDEQKLLNAKEQELEAERRESIDSNAELARKAFPDFERLVTDYCNTEGNLGLSKELQHDLAESDNGAYALYSIMKDGLLDELKALTRARAAMMIARHEDKALTLSKKKFVSSAPEPLTAARGGATGTKSLGNMKTDELLSWASVKT